MTMEPVFTIDDIRSWKPCYDPARFLPEGWSGTALDILAVEDCPANDRLWVVLREEALSARTARLFAVAVARAALALVENPDPRSIVAVDVAERHANGEASGDELDAAWAAARDAARDAAWAAARVATWDAARVAARDAARVATWDAQIITLRELLL